MLEIKLAQFEGPLDLLLHLIEKAELDIADIFVSDITKQYLALVDQMDGMDMDATSEFLQVAARLLYIKSRALLPSLPRAEDEEEEDPEMQFIRQMRQYKACKEASGLLYSLAEKAERTYARLPEEYPLPPPRVELVGVPAERLYEAFAQLLAREAKKPKAPALREVSKDRYSINDRMEHIRCALQRGACRFDALFPKEGGRMGIIVTFMAMLELVGRREISILQQGSYGEIIVESMQAATQSAVLNA